jgi:hypothetical protein
MNASWKHIRQYPRIKYPYFNEDEDFDIGDNFTNLENQSIENFGKVSLMVISLQLGLHY